MKIYTGIEIIYQAWGIKIMKAIGSRCLYGTLNINYNNLRTLTGRYMSLAFPHRENLLAKEDRLVVSGAACPGCRRGLPLVSRFLPTRE